MKVKVEMTKKNIAAEQLADRRFHQRIVKDKSKYRRNKSINLREW
jgi:hypothetical protein